MLTRCFAYPTKISRAGPTPYQSFKTLGTWHLGRGQTTRQRANTGASNRISRKPTDISPHSAPLSDMCPYAVSFRQMNGTVSTPTFHEWVSRGEFSTEFRSGAPSLRMSRFLVGYRHLH